MQTDPQTSPDPETTARLSAWYTGEVGGEAYFRAMTAYGETPAIQKKWQLLGELEHVMGTRLLTVLNGLQAPIPETSDAIDVYAASAARLSDTAWIDVMKILVPRLETFVKNIRAEAAGVPTEFSAIAADYVAHEEALLAFALAEVDGRDGSPEVQDLLDSWQD